MKESRDGEDPIGAAATCTAPALSLGLRSEASSQLSTLREGLFE
jgi:hypothetical protein